MLKALQIQMNRAALSDESENSTPARCIVWLARIPTGCPPSRASPVISSWAKRSLYGKNVLSSTMASISSWLSNGRSSRVGTISSIARWAAASHPAVAGGEPSHEPGK